MTFTQKSVKSSEKSAMLYIMVIGFHHKKGCQIEFVYPIDERIQKVNDDPTSSTSSTSSNLSTSDSIQFVQANELYKLPKKWRHLPSLALPDGSHNYESDYIYFHLEDDSFNESSQITATKLHKQKPNRTIFGVSCYRQINASELLTKDSEVTRNTLQKSVCILSSEPFYSSIRLKLQSITNAYFEQKDFHKTDLLISAFNSLSENNSLMHTHKILAPHDTTNLNNPEKSQCLMGFSLSDLVIRYQHKILVLFKLMLLQKKCLFQLNPVSNLSNTIMSLVSLVPDIFSPLEIDGTGLNTCSGFFDSIELVNCELERKNQPKLVRNVPQTHLLSPPYDESFILNSKSKIKKKRFKKKILSFSSNSNSNNTNRKSESNHSISGSFSSMSLKNQANTSPITPPNTSAIGSEISTSTQRLFSFNNSSNESKRLTDCLESDKDLYKLTGDNNDEENGINFSTRIANSVGGATNGVLNLKNGNSNVNTNDNFSFQQSKLDFKSSDTTDQSENTGQFTNLLKSKVSNVFKLVDWSSSSTPNDSPSQEYNGSKSMLKNSRSYNNHFTNNEVAKDETPSTTIKKDSKLSYSTPTSTAKAQQQSQFANNFQINELLDLNFGMPLNLFNQFNILHPYLSLYYLDYFNAINKMNTKLYCTTALMMSMMKGTAPTAPTDKLNTTELPQNESGNFTMTSTTSTPSSVTKTTPVNNSPSTQFGYTIGATNILFKQRLYDELDAFVDETEIDLKQNDQLKKQLQLTTADIRFADYILKNVNASRVKEQVRINNSSSEQIPTLLSFKKTNDEKSTHFLSASIDDLTSSSWEGSDDWIRLNFKWYLYSMLASMVKEDICNQIKSELDTILIHLSSNEISNVDTSSSSSTISLTNEVIDIDDYIEKVNNNNNSDVESISTNNADTLSQKQHKKTSFMKRKNSTGSLTSMASSFSSQYSSHVEYREDFNGAFLNEFKKTECFKEWYELNRANLEISLFKYDKSTQQFNGNSCNSSPPLTSNDNLNIRLQLLYSQLQELEKIRLLHPFNGQISVHDIKLRFNLIFTSTESGRKLNKALIEGGKIMNNTGKAVNEAFNQAKSSFSSFLNNWSFSSNSSSPQQETALKTSNSSSGIFKKTFTKM